METQNTKTHQYFLTLFLSKTECDLEIRCLPSKAQLFSRDIAELKKFIEEHLSENIYFGVCSRQGGGRAEHIKEVISLWADLDFKDYAGGEAEAHERLAAFRYAPTIVVHSGN